MTLSITIPEDLGIELVAKLGEHGQAALEALAAGAYEKALFSVEQVRRLLNLPSRWEAQNLLATYDVWPGLTADEILADAATAAHFSLSFK